MSKNAADAFISAVKSRAGMKRDEDLAASFGWSKSTIANWRMRGDIPEAQKKVLEDYSGLPFSKFVKDWFANIPAVGLLTDLAVVSVLASYFGSLSEIGQKQAVLKVWNSLEAMRSLATERLFEASSGEIDIKEYTRLSMRAESGEFLSIKDIQDIQSAQWPAQGPQ